jgi:hypothetical protein
MTPCSITSGSSVTSGGTSTSAFYSEIFDKLGTELGYTDYHGALQHYPMSKGATVIVSDGDVSSSRERSSDRDCGRRSRATS